MIRLTSVQAAKLGIPSAPEEPSAKWSDRWWVSNYSDNALEGAYRDLQKRNLRNYHDPEIRDQARRLQAIAAERRARKDAGTWSIPPRKKTAA